jgi:hypothetical protein
MKRVLVLCCAVLLAACAVVRKPETVAFSVEEAAFIKRQGKGVITGHAFRTRPLGQGVNAAGEVVWLVPATAFARERFDNLFGKGKYVPHHRFPAGGDTDPAYREYVRQTKTESNGRFAFKEVPPGSYFVMTQVTWGAEDKLFREGGTVYDRVTLTGKETEPVHLVLSGN